MKLNASLVHTGFLLGLFIAASAVTASAQRTVATPAPGGLRPRPPVTVPTNDWAPTAANMAAKFLTFDWKGTMYVVGVDDEMYTPRGKAWVNLRPGTKVRSITVKPDGTIIAPDTARKHIYSRTGSAWTDADGYADQIVATRDGKTFALLDGKILEQGKGNIYTTAGPKFTFISAPTQTDGLYAVDDKGKVYTYQNGTAGEIIGGGSAKVVAGTGSGVRAGMFINGAGTDNKTYYFEVTPKNAWVPVKSQIYMKFVALNPADGALYGIGVDNKIYRYYGTF